MIESARLTAGRARDVRGHAAARPEPVLVRRGRTRPRVRRLPRRRRLPARPAPRVVTELAELGIALRPGAQPEPVHARRHEHVGDRARPGMGDRSRAGDRRPSRRGRGGGRAPRRRGRDRDHPRPRRPREGVLALRERLGFPPVAAARHPADIALGRRRRVRAAAGGRRARARRRPPRVRGRRGVLHRRRGARPRQRVRHGPARPTTSPRSSACRRWTWRSSAPATARRCGTRARSSREYVAHRREREDRLVRALDAGLRERDELLDAAWSDAPAALRPAAAMTLDAHLEKLREEGRLPGGLAPA